MRRSIPSWRMAAVLAACAVPAALGAQRATRGADPASALTAYVTTALANWTLPGAAVAVVRNDSIVYERGFGVRELGKGAPVTPATVFAIGSTTKAFTAAALGMLVEAKRLAWDDAATRYLPGFQLADPYVTRELTVRDLLTHRSGLSRGDRLWSNSQFDRAEVLRRVRFLQPSWSFRSTYGYQNIMFLAAGTVVERVSGRTWDDFVAERIFAPLGMTNTVTSVTRLGTLADVATPHERIEGSYRPVEWQNIDNIGPAGSINSSVHDMAQWIRLQLSGGVYAGRRLVEAATIREMHRPQMVVPMSEDDEKAWPTTHFVAYGLGWNLRDYHGRKMVSHGGAIRGMRAHVTLIPEANLGVVVLVNGPQSSFPTAIANAAVDLYLGLPPRDWSQHWLAALAAADARALAARRKAESERVPNTTPSLPLASYSGTYADSMYGEIQVTQGSSGLVMTFGPQQTADLSHWNFDTFEVRNRNPVFGRGMVRFELDARGRVAALALDGLGRFGRRQPAEQGQ